MSHSPDSFVYRGPYATTTREKHFVRSEGGDSFPVELVRAIDVDADPELFEQLAAGTLHRIESSLDGRTYDLAVPVVCHDPVRRVLALVVPDALRWDELRLRKELMDRIETSADVLPSYARHFHMIVGTGEYAALQGASDVLSETEVTQIGVRPQEELAASKELARKRAELEAESSRLEREQRQMDDIRERFDREREQLDEGQAELARARQELDELRAELEADRQRLAAELLNQEAQRLRAQSGESTTSDESTQVVTDDQFIEVMEVGDLDLADAASVVEIDVDEVVIANIDAGVPASMSDLLSSSLQSTVKLINDRVLALAQVDPKRVERIFDGSPTFFVQLHEVRGYPVVSLLLARLDERDQLVEGFAWPLDPAPDGDRLILERLRDRTKLRIAFYGPGGKRLRAVEVAAPLSANVDWILERSAKLLGQPGRVKYPEARKKFEGEFTKLGTMRHNFRPDSFASARTASAVKLAAGIVGYWSKSDTFEYLIGNRSFPLEQFTAIQRRVAARAVEVGIFLNRPLRQVAIEAGLAANERALVELLIANFAETSISIRANDLEPADQWENWDALLGLGEELGLPPDPAVVELAEVSLKRAQEAEEMAERSEAALRTVEDQRTPAASPDDSLIVAKRSESTGVTYFLPNDAVLDTFDDLASMPREDLELLLNDANGRLEAAQMLIERFGASAVAKVAETAEKLNVAEAAALALFIESKAGGLEAELVRCVESGGPNATYVAAKGLAAVKSTTAIPALIDALQDDKRRVIRPRLADAIADYGDKVMPALTRAIKRDGPVDSLVMLLTLLEDRHEGTLGTLSKDRSKSLRDAARLARERREESKSA